MKISYNWLKQYINVDLDPNKVAQLLTDTGLEVEGIETVESVKGGLKGVVIGEVLTKEQHPNADRLSVTTVNVGADKPLHIVCGAPNVAAGQKVPVATIGTVMYSGDDSFKIKKGKIRGEVSEGMICAEDELGLGKDHDGIMVLDADAQIGMPASEYFKLESDTVFEIGLTPNRSDAMSHLGVARDLMTVLKLKGENISVNRPSVENFKTDNNNLPIEIEVKDFDACPRYTGLSIQGVKVAPSPGWLQKRLKAIGLSPINNVVDVTNYVLHETGQPLHAFDVAAIEGKKVVVQQLADKSKFTTLDELERELSNEDLMICNAQEGMCIAGVFGGIQSGVSDNTTDVFLESAYFNPVSVRKTAKRHGLSTDACFRFERSVDPNLVIYALKRAALLIQEVAGGSIASEITDLYPNPIQNFEVSLVYNKVDSLIGEKIDREIIQSILTDLEIEILRSTDDGLELSIPPFRADVQRAEDVIEEILRIYGYNSIAIPSQVRSSLSYAEKPDAEHLQNMVSDLLSSKGFNECMNNSLTKTSHTGLIEELSLEHQVELLNPLSQDLNGMRQSLLFSGLENVAHNINRKNADLKLYEFGKTYHQYKEYTENRKLMLLACGKQKAENWNNKNDKIDLFWMKEQVEHILIRLGITKLKGIAIYNSYLNNGFSFAVKKNTVATFGTVKKKMLKAFDVKSEVLYAEFDWDTIIKLCKASKTTYQNVPKFPAVRRDLALLVDTSVEFNTLQSLANQCENQLLKSVNLFDVYEGNNLPTGKKSYALSFVLQDENKTLTDKHIDKTMEKLIKVFQEKAGAEIRM
ncbi:MAG: phenylalanine--tRNA ligase subunit beta [Flavobacteriales bacterium]|nr:phenylalanine--tRNA ligase subunit beta [Flavobacteriales bacterium]